MRSSPLSSLHMTLRVFAKAIILLLVLNFICVSAKINLISVVTRINTWWIVGHGRSRLTYRSDFGNGQLPLETLLGGHAIAYTSKASDEYRVIVLGDSGIQGVNLPDTEDFSSQLNARQLRIGGKRVVAYNLAYPSPNVTRDVLILDAALPYKPDLVLWFVTTLSVYDGIVPINANHTVFFDLNRARLEHLAAASGLDHWFSQHIPPEAWWQSAIAIRNQSVLPIWLNSLLYPFVPPGIGQTAKRIGSIPIPAQATYHSGLPGFDPWPNETWQFLLAGQTLAAQAGAPILFVNEPMLVSTGLNSDINYNALYERTLYDSYRKTLMSYAQSNKLWFLDLWNIIPADVFDDTEFHMVASGWSSVIDHIVPELQNPHAN